MIMRSIAKRTATAANRSTLMSSHRINHIAPVSATSNVQLRTAYGDKIIDHYSNPRNVGSLDKDSTNVGTGLVGAPACGDVMKFQIEVKDGVIVDAKFKTFGCGSAIASSSYATEYVKGKTIEECLQIKNKDIAQHLALPPVKLHCSMLAEDAIKHAIYDYKKKQEKSEKQETSVSA